jgi:type II secretory pathway component PulF
LDLKSAINMAVFEYKAIDLDSSATGGTIVADSPSQARELLRAGGLTVTRVLPLRQKRLLLPGRKSPRSQREVLAFVRELATLLRAGIPLLSALDTLSQQRGRHFGAMVQDLADKVTAGVNLGDAMSAHKEYFDDLCVSIVAVGENTGSLDAALQRLADYKEKSAGLSNRLTTALIYPAIVLALGLAVAVFLMSYVVPNLLTALNQAGRELPAVTRAVKSISDLLRGWWWLLLIAAAAVAVGVRALLATDRGRLASDRLILRLPLIGPLARKENTSRLAVMLAALLRSGLPFVEALQIARGTTRNRVFRSALSDYQEAVIAGADVAAPLEKSGVFAPMVVQMLAVGQKSGQLEEMLEQLAQAYDQQVATATSRLTAVAEPLLIVLMAILVGFIAFATILPILELSNVL